MTKWKSFGPGFCPINTNLVSIRACLEVGFEGEKNQFFDETRLSAHKVSGALFETHTWNVGVRKVTKYHQKSGLFDSKVGLQTCSKRHCRFIPLLHFGISNHGNTKDSIVLHPRLQAQLCRDLLHWKDV